MPFYEYRCADCGEVFTLLQQRTAAREGHECPQCHSTRTARVFSTFAAVGERGTTPVSRGGGGNGGGGCCGGGCCHHH